MPEKPHDRQPRQPEDFRRQIRTAVNQAGVEMVERGFSAIDQLAEIGKEKLKRAIVNALIGKK
jgi:hypothetical protein